MSNQLKDPFRFKHTGVRSDLTMLVKTLKKKKTGIYQFGSSGDGEITVQGSNGSVYVRKYKKGSEWRLKFYIGKEDIDEKFKSNLEIVIKEIVESGIDK